MILSITATAVMIPLLALPTPLHSPPYSPSPYELDYHLEHFINPPPGPTNLTFYSEMSVTFNSRLPALIKIHSDAGKADCRIQDSDHDCDSQSHDDEKSVTDPSDAVENNDGANDTADKNITDDENKNNFVANFVAISDAPVSFENDNRSFSNSIESLAYEKPRHGSIFFFRGKEVCIQNNKRSTKMDKNNTESSAAENEFNTEKYFATPTVKSTTSNDDVSLL